MAVRIFYLFRTIWDQRFFHKRHSGAKLMCSSCTLPHDLLQTGSGLDGLRSVSAAARNLKDLYTYNRPIVQRTQKVLGPWFESGC